MDIIKTQDGSHTLTLKCTGESYHSKHGAIQESQHVFINAGLKPLLSRPAKKGPLHILEIGFGTGLNALLTTITTQNTPIQYTAIEPYPIGQELWSKLNYPEQLAQTRILFDALHTTKWESPIAITPTFTLHKTQTPLIELSVPPTTDLIYFDAFSPEIAPGLWTETVFEQCYNGLNDNGVLVTYCAKGIVKQRLRQACFTIERLPGAPGKHHMIRATKTSTL